ncbi:FAD-binding oxidoreductase [Sphaerisporangium perillae]|uniref:FAD-binding oxidoreductase n=1 Tax=Sphaerisporangium perillae TaxID=2935860 RepID=UPI00200E1656|nr:FAD-binding protein [Sphaerisporangium perillae]
MIESTALAADLRRAVRGRVLVRGDEGFDIARAPWDGAIDQRVIAVVEAEDAADAAAVVGCARLAGVAVATQPEGHAPSAFEDAILLRTGRLRGVEIRPEQRVARVEAGVRWGEVLTASGKHDLTGLAGSTAVVSATGFTLGGGLSWFGRRYGIAANSVRSLDVVDAEGARARVTADSDPELFWALRGGDFALVTAMEFDLHPAPELYGGRILWPAAQAEQVLSAFRGTTAEAPDELSVWFTLLQFPPFPELPEPLRGLSAVAIDVTWLGREAEGRALLHRFDRIPGAILDTRGRMPVAELGAICAEPTDPTPALFHGELLTGLGDDAAASLLAATLPTAAGTIAPLVSVQIRHLGGAIGRPAGNPGACGHIAEPYLLGLLGVLPVPELAEPIKERQASIARALMPYTTGRKPFTFLKHEERAAAAFPGDTLARLRDIKRRRDPNGVFHSNHPVLG